MTEPRGSGTAPLAGVRVLELAGTLPGPYCGHLLRLLGATVIKLEPPSGDPLRTMMPAMFEAFNRGKRSVVVDLKRPDAPDIVAGMIPGVDVVIEGFRPGVADRLGVGAARLRALRPDLIYCSLSGFGQTGLRSDRPGHDATYAAIAGVLLPVARGKGVPRMSPVPLGDLAAGLMAAFLVVTALLERVRRGDGRAFDLAIADVLLSWGVARGAEALQGSIPEAASQEPPTHDVFETLDGRYVALGAIEDKFWVRLCKAIGRDDWLSREELASNSGRAEADWLRSELRAEFLQRDAQTWVTLGEVNGVPIEHVRRLDEALSDEAFRERSFVRDVDGVIAVGLPVVAEPPLAVDPLTAAPALGADTRLVLEELGLEDPS